MFSMKKFSALLVTGVLVSALAACSSSSPEDCTALAAENGSAVNSVKVSLGTAGTPPTATFPTPLVVSGPEVKVLKGGNGQKLLPGESYSVELAFYNGQTGESMGATTFNGQNPQSASLDKTSPLSFLNSVLQCAKVGSRIVGVVPSSQLVSADGADLTGGSKDMTLVVIADLVSISLNRANGADQPAVEGLPVVKLADNGAPSITIPSTAAPTELKVAVLKKGTGPVVSSSSTVIVHYTGMLWDGGKIFDSSWARNQTASFPISGVVAGFGQALTGQTVGSQILTVIPPALGYGSAGAGSSVPPNSTLVFVVDILGIAK
jgi:peptidylprolyl isomerase